MTPAWHAIALSAALFGIGLVGALLRRNLLATLLSVQLLIAASVLAFVGFEHVHAADAALAASGRVAALVAIAVAAAELALGIGLVLAVVRGRDSMNADDLSLLRW